MNAVSALCNLASDEQASFAIRDAGGVEPLVALLSAGRNSEAARDAAGRLQMNITAAAAIRVAAGVTRCAAFPTAIAIKHSVFRLDVVFLGGAACGSMMLNVFC